MRVEMDIRKPSGAGEPFAGIRIYPETNKDMGELEYFIKFFSVKDIQKNVFMDSVHYVITSEPKP